jgi:hypothetical protein
MRRIHNTASNVIDLSRRYGKSRHFKPNGFWYSIESEWKDWCESEMSQWIKPNWFSVDLDMEKILVIQTPFELSSFQKKYRVFNSSISIDINWKRVKENYSGIEILNYHELKRFSHVSGGVCDFIWLYGWDINSGCIWDLSCVRSVQKLNKEDI